MLFKNTLIKIKKSFGRYLSIFFIVLLGVGFLSGLQATAPDIISVADKYYKSQKLMDFKIVSSMGLTDNDVEIISSLNNVKAVIPSYSMDVTDQDKAIRIHALENSVNTVKIIEGRIPQNLNECVADDKFYNIGDQITISDEYGTQLKNKNFTVVGTIESVLYLSGDYGSTTVGDGKLSSFIFINRENFNMNIYTEIYVLALGTQNVSTYSKDYTNAVQKLKDDLTSIKNSTTYVFDRSAAIGYSDLKSSSDIVSSVALVFPFFFILIVMLMTSNSMSRMIAEERSELGALTSLGYKDESIILTYLFYVLSASLLGATTGFFLGCRIFPPLIFSMFKFFIPSLIIQYNIITFLIILAVTIALMVVVTIVSCNRELKQKPAFLLRPAILKKGETILLEKITFIWKHLSFTWKITIRNLFRYKKRAFMTIVGIAGCTALLLAGFGLRDSMNGVAQKQYKEIFKYDDMIILKEETQEISNDLSVLLEEEYINSPLLIKQTAVKCLYKDNSSDVYMVIPQDDILFNEYFTLNNLKSGNLLKLIETGVIITQKLSDNLDVGVGDLIKIKDNNKEFQFTVTGIAENYISNYVYIPEALYSKIFDAPLFFNTIVSHHNSNDEKALAENLINSGFVLNVIFTDDVIDKALDDNKSLNGIIVLIVAVSSLLAFIVLYNLTAINISERKREIATLKVLGFTDKETNNYIYREVLILTIISILIGLFLGIFLHGFIVDIVEGASIMFFRNIKWSSFLISGMLTLTFSFIMQIITYFKLQKIDMNDALKSVE